MIGARPVSAVPGNSPVIDPPERLQDVTRSSEGSKMWLGVTWPFQVPCLAPAPCRVLSGAEKAPLPSGRGATLSPGVNRSCEDDGGASREETQ